MLDASITSPAKRGVLCLRTVTSPLVATCSIRTSVAVSTVTDFSEPKKSPSLILAT